jgi:hypothetical protein
VCFLGGNDQLWKYLNYRDIFKTDEFTDLRFNANGAWPAANFADDSAYWTADNVWNKGK